MERVLRANLRRWLLGVAVLLAACDGEVTRRPVGEGGGVQHTPSGPTVRVDVVDRLGRPVEGNAVLVHDSSGALRSRQTSRSDGVHVDAEPGDSISVIWASIGSDDGPWRLESVRVTESVTRVLFYIDTRRPESNPNAPLRVEVEQAISRGVPAYAVALDCGIAPMWKSDPVSFAVDGYNGCASRSRSLVVGMGRDENERLLTFDAVMVPHDPGTTATILFPSTPVVRRPVEVTIDPAPGWSIPLLDGRVRWKEAFLGYDELIDGLPATEPALPLTLSFEIPKLPFAETTASFGLVLEDGGEGSLCHDASVALTESLVWSPTRLRRGVLSADGETFQVLNPDSTGAFHDEGDALMLNLNGARFWEPVPADGEARPVPSLQMPADLPQTFGPVHIGGYGARHEDRRDEDGYAAYLERGVGEMREVPIPAERLGTRCSGGG